MNFPLTIFRRPFWIITLSLTLLLYPLPSWAITVQDVPNPRQEYGGWVTDMAEMLSASTEAQLNQMISELEAKNGSEIAVVTVPETKPAATPKEFTSELFNYWGIGKKDKNNGVLFLVSQSDRRVEIETGKGIQKILPDAKVSNLIDTKIIPEFKLGQFESGILAGTKELVISLKNEGYNLVIFIGIFIGILLVSVFHLGYLESIMLGLLTISESTFSIGIGILAGLLLVWVFRRFFTRSKKKYTSTKSTYSNSSTGDKTPISITKTASSPKKRRTSTSRVSSSSSGSSKRRSVSSNSSSSNSSYSDSSSSSGGYDSGNFGGGSSSGSYDSGSFGGGSSDGGGGGGDW